jgi:predicted nucleic acid-binding protein
LADDERLGKDARKVVSKADCGGVRIFIPTIVLAESLFVAEKHRIDIEFMEILMTIRKSRNYIVYPLDLDVVIKCRYLKDIPELHDRILVSTAKILDAKVLTKDREIHASGVVEAVWQTSDHLAAFSGSSIVRT